MLSETKCLIMAELLSLQALLLTMLLLASLMLESQVQTWLECMLTAWRPSHTPSAWYARLCKSRGEGLQYHTSHSSVVQVVHRTGLLPQFMVFVDKYEAVMKVLLARSVTLPLCTVIAVCFAIFILQETSADLCSFSFSLREH